MELRVAFARSCSPTDLFTLIARLVVRRIATLLTFVLWPIDQAARVVGHGLIAVVLGFLVLIILTLVWFPIWGMLVGTSWLWLRYPWNRPFLLLPGIILAIVAAVYTNRLARRMPLQCDPTVIYALMLDGLYDGNLTRENLRYDSPYNTYVYAGLPPGPISAPGAADLWAALHPSDDSYLYFVSRNDGGHVFANTLREHNRNVREYQVDYFRRRRAAGR